MLPKRIKCPKIMGNTKAKRHPSMQSMRGFLTTFGNQGVDVSISGYKLV